MQTADAQLPSVSARVMASCIGSTITTLIGARINSGFIDLTVVTPLDVVKTRWQSQQALHLGSTEPRITGTFQGLYAINIRTNV